MIIFVTLSPETCGLHLPRHIDFSLILRGIAAALVVFWHVDGYKGEWPAAINVPGRVSVWLFFIISGYVIAFGFVHRRYAFHGSDLVDFYRNRFLRIYPLFIALSIISAVTLFVQEGSTGLTVFQLIAEALGLQWNHSYTLSGVFWTLGIELQFYLVAPLIAWLLIRRSNSWKVPAFIYAALFLWPLVAHKLLGIPIDNRTTVGNLHHFTTGMIVAVYLGKSNLRERVSSNFTTTINFAAACALIALASYLYHMHARAFWLGGGAILVDVAGALFLLVHSRMETHKIARGRSVVRGALILGVLSYGLYAWHGYFLKYFPFFSDRIIWTFCVSLAAAYCSYELLERRALAFKRHPTKIKSS